MSQGIAHEVHPATLPGRLEHPGDGRLDALVGVGDHQLDPGQAAALEPAQEVEPEGFGFRGADAHAQDLAPAVARSEEHTSELQSLMRISYAVFCLKKKKKC